MMKKLVAVAALVAVLVLGGCAQGQGGPSAEASSGGVASVSSGAQPVDASDASAGLSGEAPAKSPAATPGAEPSSGAGSASEDAAAPFYIVVDGARLEVAPADTQAARDLEDRLQAGPVAVSLRAYGGFEKVGPLPWALTASDGQVTAQPGDVMLYQGDQITVFTGSNSWAYTPLGRIEGATAESLSEAFGDGDVEVVLSM